MFIKKTAISIASKAIACIGLFSMSVLLSCAQDGSFLESPDGHFRATTVGAGADTDYQVVEIGTGRIILTTKPQYDTPNDVKVGGFSSDSKKFAAVYHYGHDGGYSWTGVWNAETGQFLYSRKTSGWTRSVREAFE